MGPRGGRLRGVNSGSARYGGLRRSVTRKTDREGGRDDKAFEHRNIPVAGRPNELFLKFCLNYCT